MSKVDLMIGIGAEYKGKPAFDRASKQVNALNKSVGILAKRFVSLYAAQKLYSYGKQSVQAFAEDDLAAQKLSKTLENLNLAYETTNVESFIASLEKTYHIADDFLRPAFSKLISVTQSYTKSKELMMVALNASNGAGVDLSTTINDLSQAYVGNLKGLKKYNLGLTTAELATKSFAEIQQLLTNRFKGQASQAAGTFSSQMDALTIATGNAKEIIGKSLVGALTEMAGKKGDIENLAQSIEDLGSALAALIGPIAWLMKNSGLGLIVKGLETVGSKEFKKSVNNIIKGNDNSMLEQTYGKYDPLKKQNLPKQYSIKELKLLAKRAQADKDAAKRQKELAALLAKQLKASKDAIALAKAKAVLDKASAVMNMDLIQNTAALMQSTDEDTRTRLLLQQALLLGNADEAGNLAQKLLAAQGAALQLAGANPLDGWKSGFDLALEAIEKIRKALADLGSMKVPFPVAYPPADGGMGKGNAPFVGTPFGQAGSFVDSIGTPFGQAGSFVDSIGTPFGQAGGNGTQTMNIVITAEPGFIATAQLNDTANGNLSQFNRTTNNW